MTAISTPARVVSRETASIKTRNYGTRFKLFTAKNGVDELSFFGSPVKHPNMGGDHPIDTVCRQVIDNIFSVEGVGYITVRPFEVNISRATAFDWEEIDQYLTYLIASADPLLKNSVLPAPPALPRPERIRWFDTRSHQLRHYGVTTRLFTPAHDLDTERNWPGIGSCPEQETIAPQGAALLERLSNIDGVSSVNLQAFEANVCKYDHFSWSELHEPVLDAMRACFPDPAKVPVHNRYEWD